MLDFWKRWFSKQFRVSKRRQPRRSFRPMIEQLEDRLVPTVDMLSAITGINNTAANPPDTGVAAGTNYVVETVNNQVAIYKKSTGTLVSQEYTGTLFSGLYTHGLSDPEVMYDDIADRFVVAELTSSSYSTGPYKAYIDFAVSKSSDPTQGFSTFEIEVDQGGLVWLDNGKLGYNADGWFYTGNQYGGYVGGGETLLSINKSTFSSKLLDINGFSVIPARMHGAVSGGPEYFVESSWYGGSSVTLWQMTDVLSSSPSLTTYNLATDKYSEASINQPGGSLSFDARVESVEWNNNNLMAAWNSEDPDGTDASAFWIEFNTGASKPTVTQQEFIHPAAGISTSMPALAVDAAGDIALTYIQSSSTQYPSMYVTGRLASDPLNTLEGSVEVRAGNITFSGGRIGDYAGLSLDPSSSNTFWAGNEYGLSGTAGNWGTALAQFQVATPNANVAPPTITTFAGAGPNPVTGTTTNLSVGATDASGGSDLVYTWSVLSEPSGAKAPTYSVNPSTYDQTTATFFAAGTYTFQVAVSNGGGSVTSDTTVTVNQTLTSIAVSPSWVNLTNGATQQFKATALDQFKQAMAAQPAFTWSVATSGVGGTITSTGGLYTAPSTGSGKDTIHAKADGLTGSATVNVGSAPAAPSNLTAATVSASQIQLSWLNNANNETSFVIQNSINSGSTWTTLTTISSTAAAGTTVTYTASTLVPSTTYEFRTAAKNVFGTSAWSNVSNLATTLNSSVAAPTITAAASAAPNPVTGTTTTLSVGATDASGGTDLIYTWSVLSEPSGVSSPSFSVNASNSASSTTAAFHAAGNYTFQAAVSNSGGIRLSDVTVTVDQSFTSMKLTPTLVGLLDGATQQFTATALDQFGHPLATQPSFTWSLASSSVGTISSGGLYTGPGTGTGKATVEASYGGKTSTAAVYVGLPTAPSNLAATVVSSTQVDLTWTNNANNQQGFIIQRSADGGSNWAQLATLGPGAVSYADKTASSGSTYEYRVEAYNPLGDSAWSNLAAATTPSTAATFAASGGTDLVHRQRTREGSDGLPSATRLGTWMALIG